MSGKPLLIRALAHRDVEAAGDYYAREARPDIALGFIDALQSTYRTIAGHPALGSSRYAQELALPGLRSLAVRGFPYLVFYPERDARIDVWRVLHGRSDIPSRMRETEA